MRFNTPQEIAADVVRELTENPRAWTQGYFASDEFGIQTYSSSCSAVCWCSAGHIIKRAEGSLCDDTFGALVGVIGRKDVAEWNDAPGRTVEEVKAAFQQLADLPNN